LENLFTLKLFTGRDILLNRPRIILRRCQTVPPETQVVLLLTGQFAQLGSAKEQDRAMDATYLGTRAHFISIGLVGLFFLKYAVYITVMI
jgi:hypothetical protein